MASKAAAQKARRVDGRFGRRDLVLAGADSGKLRRKSARDWTKKKEAAFLTALAETCNITLSAAEAGVGITTVYTRRNKNAAFRAAWNEALSVAYRRLELMLLERSFNGTEKVITRKDGSEERVREYPNAIALQLLKMHKDTVEQAEREPAAGELEELREKLQRRVERLRKRLIDEGATAE